MKKTCWLWAIMMLLSLQTLAVPATPSPISFTQPGTKEQLNIFLKGDERVHWAETEDGYSLLHADDGSLYYAMRNDKGDMVVSPFRATAKEHRTLSVVSFLAATPQHLLFSQAQVDAMLKIWTDLSQMKRQPKDMTNVVGEKRFLVILFAFSDCAFTHTAAEFESLFNQVNYTAGGNTGSVHDYYYRVSQGLFSLNVDVVGPFTGTRTTAHYGNNGSDGYQDFAEEAVDSAARFVNFSDYDNDHDGYIDGLHIIFAGNGEEATSNDDQIWSHKWYIFSAPELDSTIVNVYSCSPECAGTTSDLTAIGVICHELGHVFGAPDYYDTDYSESGGQYAGLGNWDIMSGGSWNRSGHTPAQHNPYTKIYVYHWATCDTLSSPQQVVMQSSDKVRTDFHRINTGTEGDFFLLENRQRNDFDAVIPGHGLVVYHVHPDAHGASVSNSTHPQQLYIMAHTADTFPSSTPSSYGTLNDASATFPGTSRRTQLTDYTCPALRPWNQALNHTPLTHISENTASEKIYFCFNGALPSLQSLVATGESDMDVKLQWEAYGSLNVLLLANTADRFSSPTAHSQAGDTLAAGDIVAYRGNATGITLSNLQNATTYYYRLYLLTSDSTLSTSYLADTAVTLRCGASDWRSETFSETDGSTLPDCWAGDGWVLETADGTLRCRNLVHDGADYGDTNTLALPPFRCDSNYAQQHFVLSFDLKSNGADSLLRMNVLLKNGTDSAWTLRYSSDTLGGNAWKRIHVQLYNCTRYSQLRLQVICPDSDVRRNSTLSIDNVSLAAGCLLHSYASTEGGELSVEGYNVFPQDSTLRLTIRRHPGYAFDRLYFDDHRQYPVMDTLFYVDMSRQHTLYTSFKRKTAIDESKDETLALYPNPVQNQLHVTLPASMAADAPLALYDILGRPVLQQRAAGGHALLDLSALQPGIYILHAGNQNFKIVKE